MPLLKKLVATLTLVTPFLALNGCSNKNNAREAGKKRLTEQAARPDQMRADHLLWWWTLDGLDLDILDTILSSGWISEVLLWSKGSYRYPLVGKNLDPDDVAHRRTIEKAIALCRSHNVTPILLRSLWPDVPRQEPPDHMYDPDFYRARWTLTAREAALFNVAWAFDIEPYKPQHDKPTAIYTLIREQHEMHATAGPRITAAIGATSGLEQPTYLMPAATPNHSSLYSQIGQTFDAARRIAIPPSYDPDRSDRVTIEHEAIQWLFASRGTTGRFNFANVSHLVETRRRILVFIFRRYIAEFADQLLATPASR